MSTTLPLFWDLPSSSKTKRVEASVKLIGALEQFQASFTPILPKSSNKDEDEDENMNMDAKPANNDGLDGPNAPDVAYSIRRLVRGLASPRESSRLGFAVALTELLSRLDTISASQIFALITQASQVRGTITGQEERDMFFARLFGITSLVRSGILFRSTPLSTSSLPASTFKDFQNAMIMLLALPSAKSFLREPSYWTFILALRALDTSEVEWKGDAWTWVADTLFMEDRTWSPEKLGVALIMKDLGVEMDWKTMLAPEFKHGDPLSSGSLSNVAKILRDVDVDDTDAATAKSKRAGVWKPQLHFVWNVILDIYFPSNDDVPITFKPQTSYTDFFKIVVDDSLLAPTSSDGRKLWGFELFRLSVTRIPATDLPRLFGPNFMRSWVNHLSKPDRYLHKAAKLVASALPPVITANPPAGFPLLLQLTKTHGHFDRLTRTKTVESLLVAMDVEGVQEYIRHLGELARCPSGKASTEGENDPTATRIWVADQFTALVRNGAIPKADAWVSEVLNFFVLHSLFGIRKKNEKSENQWLHVLPDPAFSDEARAACRPRLLSCLAELTSQTILIKTGDEKTVRGTGVASDGELWVSKVMHGIVTLEKDTKHVIRLGLGEEELLEEVALRDRTLEVVERLKSVSREEPAEGAELVLVGTLLYRYMNDERESDQDVEACLASVTRLFPAQTFESSKGKKKKTKQLIIEDDALHDTEIDPIDALVDTLIGYLEKSTAYLRVIANQVFGLLTGLVGRGAVDLILAQLERRDPTGEGKDDDGTGVSDEGDDDAAQSEKSSSDSDSQEQDDDEELDDSEEDPELRKKIMEVLRLSGILPASEGSDGSASDSSEEEFMDDEQMMQLDAHLAEVFRSRAKEKSHGDTGAQREATHFKNRVLDLVDIFLRKQPTNTYVPHFILPLVQVIMGTGSDEKQLSDKVTAVLRSRIGKAKEIPTTVDLPHARETLKELHVLARKTHSSDTRETISMCSLYLTKVLLSDPIRDDQLVIEAYRTTLTDFATRKASPLQPSFILDFVRRHPRAAWQLRGDFVQMTSKAVNVYRKCQMFQLLQPLLNQIVLAAGDNSEVPEFMRTLCRAIFTAIANACDDSDSWSAPQVKELLKLSLLGVRQTKRVTADPNDLQAIWDVTGLVSLSKKLESSRFKTATSLQALCKHLHAVIGSNLESIDKAEHGPGNPKKRKAEGMEGEVKKARRKKTKKRRD